MHSPPVSPLSNLQGASRITGGILRGRNRHNAFKPGDDFSFWETPAFSAPSASELEVFVRIFKSEPDNLTTKPDLLVPMPKVDTLGEVLSIVLGDHLPQTSGIFFVISKFVIQS